MEKLWTFQLVSRNDEQNRTGDASLSRAAENGISGTYEEFEGTLRKLGSVRERVEFPDCSHAERLAIPLQMRTDWLPTQLTEQDRFATPEDLSMCIS